MIALTIYTKDSVKKIPLTFLCAGIMRGGDELHSLVATDTHTSHHQWMDFVRRLQAEGHKELGIQLLAVVTVTTSMRQALDVFSKNLSHDHETAE
jgi:hypothetical protein